MSNAPYPVNAVTRQKVLEAAEILGYAPNTLARSLRSQRSRLLAVLVGDNVDPYFAEIMRGVEEVANQLGYLTIVCNTERSTEREIHYLATLRDYRVDGIIFAGSGIQESQHLKQVETLVNDMLGRGTVVVTLSHHTLQVPSIQADNFAGARRMTQRLIELGHHRIAFVTGPSTLAVVNVRLQGYMLAMLEAGLTVNQDLLLPGNFDLASGEHVAALIMRMPPAQRPTAIFAANDEMAFGVMRSLMQHGLRIPQDCSVCGFGDIPMAQFILPALTSVQIPLRAMGRNGARTLISLLRQESVAPLEILPTTIIERDSTAAYHA
jgi:LacI family transcriptional regulator